MISVRQLFSVDSTVEKVKGFCSILHLALLGKSLTTSIVTLDVFLNVLLVYI